VTDLARLGALVDREGGLRVHLTDAVEVGNQVMGPGDVTLSGTQLQVFLALPQVNTFTRWEIVLGGLLASPPAFRPGDLTQTDGAREVQAVLSAAAGAELQTLPVQVAAATVRVPKYGELDDLMAERFGVRRTPIPVIVQNGAGVPGLGELVARSLIPRGFRITLSQNADSFDHATTEFIAIQNANIPEARRARAALGVGHVTVTRVPSGIGDVVIVVGKDFTA
jgi:hypothetical protein